MTVCREMVYLTPGARTEARKRHYAAASASVTARSARLEKPKRKSGKKGCK